MKKIASIFVMVLVLASCSNQAGEQLQTENKVLKEKAAQLEKQLKTNNARGSQNPSVTQETTKSEINSENLLLAKKLNAVPSDFLEKEVKLQCEFYRIENYWLDHEGAYFPSSKYLAFFATVRRTEKGIDSILFQTLFINKHEGEILYQLNLNDRITIYGKVKSARAKRPWIEVFEIKKGWE